MFQSEDLYPGPPDSLITGRSRNLFYSSSLTHLPSLLDGREEEEAMEEALQDGSHLLTAAEETQQFAAECVHRLRYLRSAEQRRGAHRRRSSTRVPAA